MNFKNLLLVATLFLAMNAHAQAVDPNTFEKGLNKEVQLLDVRTPEEFLQGHIANAMLANIHDDAEFERRIQSLDKTKPVYVYCLAGGRSHNAAGILQEKGFKEIVELAGGVNAWRNAGKKLEGNTNVPQMTKADYDKMINAAPLVLVDFGAPWCPPCRKMNPIVAELEKKFEGKVKFMRIDGGAQAGLMKTNKIEQMPGFVLYKNGKEIWRHLGEISKEEFEKVLNK